MSSYDGELKFDTRIDKTGFVAGIESIGSLAKSGMTAVTAAVGAASAAVAALGGAAVKVGIDFESAFAGVKKTVDASNEEFAAIREGILAMSEEMPASAAEIAAVAN